MRVLLQQQAFVSDCKQIDLFVCGTQALHPPPAPHPHHPTHQVPQALIVFYLFNMMEYGNQAAAAEIKLALSLALTRQLSQQKKEAE